MFYLSWTRSIEKYEMYENHFQGAITKKKKRTVYKRSYKYVNRIRNNDGFIHFLLFKLYLLTSNKGHIHTHTFFKYCRTVFLQILCRLVNQTNSHIVINKTDLFVIDM